MKIVTVIPLIRGTFREHLSYFSSLELAPGDLVIVPLRNKPINALVTKISDAAEAKAELRRAEYGMKKVTSLKARGFLPSAVVEAAQELADYYAAALGPTLKLLLPKIMLDTAGKHASPAITPFDAKLPGEKLLFQDTDEERLSDYKNMTREAFARGQSVFICLPTASEVRAARASLERGIAHYTMELHSNLGEKLLKENWKRALSDTHPLLIIGTPAYLSLSRADLTTIILDRESASNYRPQIRPFIDYRRFAEMLAAKRRSRLAFGDILLRPETVWRMEQKEWVAARPLRQHLAPQASTKIVSVQNGELWSEETKELILHAYKTGEKMCLLANRRGLAPLIVCDDCGESVTCGNCGSPLVLHQAGIKEGIQEKAIFRCHHCGETRTSEEKCRHCTSWRLRALGTGIERVAKELKALLPDAKICQLDTDSIKTPRAAEALVKKFLDTPGAILLGTEMLLNYLHEKVPHSIIITIDAMLALPDYRINERAFTLISRLRAITAKDLIIQSRQADNPALQQMTRGHLLEFYRHEISERERFDYPPFKTFIKITSSGPSARTRAIFAKLAERLGIYEPAVYPSFHQPGKGLLELNLLIKLKPSDWPDPDLSAYLKLLPPNYVVTVDPESIL